MMPTNLSFLELFQIRMNLITQELLCYKKRTITHNQLSTDSHMKRQFFRTKTFIFTLILLISTACKQAKNATDPSSPDWLSGANIVYFNNSSGIDKVISEIYNTLPTLLNTDVKIIRIAIPDSCSMSIKNIGLLRTLADSLHSNNMKIITDLPSTLSNPDSIISFIKQTTTDGIFVSVPTATEPEVWSEVRATADSIKNGFLFATNEIPTTSHATFTLTTQTEFPELIRMISENERKASDIVKVFGKEVETLHQNDIRIHSVQSQNQSTQKTDERLSALTTAFIYTLPGIARIDAQTFSSPKTDSTYLHLIRDMNKLKAGNKGLWSASYKDSFMGLRNSSPNAILSYVRFYKKTQVLCIFNFSRETQRFRITDMLNGTFDVYSGEKVTVEYNKNITLPAMSYTIQICMN